MAVFWVVAPCSLIEVYQHFRGPCCLHHQGPDDGGSKDLWNVGKLLPLIALMMAAASTSENECKLLPDYTALQPRRQPSSYSPPWEPQILTMLSFKNFRSYLLVLILLFIFSVLWSSINHLCQITFGHFLFSRFHYLQNIFLSVFRIWMFVPLFFLMTIFQIM
jgi:hypothetical protein